MRNIIFLAVAALLLLGGCAKQPLSNQAAEFWYRQMAKEIGRSNLDLAGDHYASLTSEHVRSPLIKEATLMMAMAHLHNEEYLLAGFYLDEYIKRFGSREEIDRAQYFKLVADYRGIVRPGRDQKLLLDGRDRAAVYGAQYADSPLWPYAQTLYTRTRLADNELNVGIAGLYVRLDKPVAADYYRQKSDFAPAKEGQVTPPVVWWPRSWFE